MVIPAETYKFFFRHMLLFGLLLSLELLTSSGWAAETRGPVVDGASQAAPVETPAPPLPAVQSPPMPSVPNAAAQNPSGTEALPPLLNRDGDPASTRPRTPLEKRYGGVIPSILEALKASTTVTRAQMADSLVKVLNYPPLEVSEFPFFRDVPRNYWAYAPIEVLRERGFVTGYSGGFYKPDQTVSRLDVYMTLAGVLSSVPMKDSTANMLLAPFKDRAAVPAWAKPGIARLVQEDVIRISRRRENNLNPDQKIVPADFVRLLGQLSLRVGDTGAVVARTNDESLPAIPPGMMLKVTPNSAIFRSKLAVGDYLYFTLLEDVPVIKSPAKPVENPEATKPLPDELPDVLARGTLLRARVNGIENENIWIFRLNQAKTPDNKYFRLKALLKIRFQGQGEQSFVVPGQTFEVPTQAFTPAELGVTPAHPAPVAPAPVSN